MPRMTMKIALRACPQAVGISLPSTTRSTLVAVNRFSELPACSKQAQNAALSAPAELKILRTAFGRHHAHYRDNRAAALKLIGAGEAPRDQQLDSAEHAAYAAVCNLILNLDEVITKE